MVFFVCNACQETLKLKALENHGYKCRGTLCCVDCSKDFSGADARKHTTCISEAEKYEKTLYRGPKKGGKVDPQELWTAQVAKAAAGATKHRELLERLTAYSNAPRKLPKFVNFARNSIGVRDERILKELFDMIVAVGEPRPGAGGAGAAARAPAAADVAEKPEAAGSSSGAAAAPVAALPIAGEVAVASGAPETVTGKKRKRAEAEESSDTAAAPAASAGTKLARTGVPDSDDDEDGGRASSAGAGSAAKSAPKLKALMLQRLQAAKLEGDARVKAKSLRKVCVAAAVAGGRYADEEAAGAAFDKTLGKLSAKGKLALSENGKYATVA